MSDFLILVLLETGDLSAAEQCVADGLARALRVGDTTVRHSAWA